MSSEIVRSKMYQPVGRKFDQPIFLPEQVKSGLITFNEFESSLGQPVTKKFDKLFQIWMGQQAPSFPSPTPISGWKKLLGRSSSSTEPQIPKYLGYEIAISKDPKLGIFKNHYLELKKRQRDILNNNWSEYEKYGTGKGAQVVKEYLAEFNYSFSDDYIQWLLGYLANGGKPSLTSKFS